MIRFDEHASHAPRRRWWQDLRWIAAGMIALLVGLLVWGLFGPEPPITVSRETTYLTEPLAADGLPDYGAAVLASLGPAPRPEDNAAVELLEVMWPLGIDAADLPAVCTALGIPHVPPADPLREPTEDAAAKVTDAMFDAAQNRPWTADEFPELAAWLVAHEAELDRLVAAVDRPRYWLPSPTLLRPGPQDPDNFCELELRDLYNVARLLVCRAHGHVGAGRHAAAWQDIRAVYRLSRLLAAPENTPQFENWFWLAITNNRAAIIFNYTADDALTLGLLGSPDLPADVLAVIRRDLEALGPLPEPQASRATQRLYSINWIVWLARRTPGGRTRQLNWSDPLLEAALLTSLDWDIVLRRMNAKWDRLETAVHLPTRAARQTEVGRLEREFCERFRRRSAWATAGHALWGCCSRGHRSVFVGDNLWSRLCSIEKIGLHSLTRTQASFGLTRTAAALAAWKADRVAGEEPYPETLAALVPTYLPAVPLDPFSDEPFIYERRGEGYLLASVGPNGVYDGGNELNGWIVAGEWQTTAQGVDYYSSDVVVRMPVPPALPAKP